MGKFVTHMGYEVIESREVELQRVAPLALAIPYYHGIRAAYPVSQSTVTGYLYNGWNNLRDNNDETVGASLIASPTDRLSLIAGWPGATSGGFTGVRAACVMTVMFRPTDNLAFAVSSYGTENQPSEAPWVVALTSVLSAGATGIALKV
jgi:hypothetical protein